MNFKSQVCYVNGFVKTLPYGWSGITHEKGKSQSQNFGSKNFHNFDCSSLETVEVQR